MQNLVAGMLCLISVFAFANNPLGQTVDKVAPGSTYEKLALRPGDRILSFDGKDGNSPGDSVELYNALKKGTVKTVVIERDGAMSDIKVLSKTNDDLNAEAIRVLKSLKTKWTAGIKDGQAVRTKYTLPITVVSE